MSAPKFTPKPWRWGFVPAEGNRSDAYVLFGGDNGYRVMIIGDNWRAIPVGADEKLISAAPELYEALELALATIERLAVRHGPFCSADGTMEVARAALAKARGESEGVR